jgi:hypothetical protein
MISNRTIVSLKVAEMISLTRLFLFLWIVCVPALGIAQEFSTDSFYIDPKCVADDENFIKLFDVIAFGLALFGCFLLPLFWPFVPGVANDWRWVNANSRWFKIAGLFSASIFLLVFLPPQLTRVGVSPRISLALYRYVGNVRSEYLDCDLSSFSREYGYLFFLGWNPGPNILISYWWVQLVVFLGWVSVFGLAYWAILRWLPSRRLEAK